MRVITTVVASLLPVCSVIVQFFVTSNLLRLVLIIVASGFFALALVLMTNARVIEVFAATSASVALFSLSIPLLSLNACQDVMANARAPAGTPR
jgi:hypothetical protein